MPRVQRALVLGPGLLFVLSMLGPGDLVSNVTIGATRGYSMIWILALVLGFRFVWLDLSARYVLATGETLLCGYARRGRWIPWMVLGSLLASRHLTNLYKILLVGTAANMLLPLPFPGSAAIWSLLFAGLGFLLMHRGIRAVERWFRPVIALMGAALFAAAALSHPDFPAILRGMLPGFGGQAAGYSTVLLVTALIGAEAGALTNISYSYFMYQKGWRDTSFLRSQRFDLAASVGCIFLMGVLLQIAAAGTLMPAHMVPRNAEHLVAVFSSTLGLPGRLIFAFGLWTVCFSGFTAGTSGYAIIASDILDNFTSPTWRSRLKGARPWLIAFWSFSPLYILLTRVQPVWLVLAVSSLTVLLMPALGIVLLVITNDRERMGALRNGLAVNLMLSALILTTFYFSIRNAIELVHRL